MSYPPTTGFWLPTIAATHASEMEWGWVDYAEERIGPLADFRDRHGLAGDLTIHAPAGLYRASLPETPEPVAAIVASRTRNKERNGDRAEVWLHPEAWRWSNRYDGRNWTQPENWWAFVARCRDLGFGQITVYLGSFRYLALPRLGDLYPYYGSPVRKQNVSRIAFDQDVTLRPEDYAFLSRIQAKRIAVALELRRSSEMYPTASVVQLQARLSTLEAHRQNPDYSYPRGENVRAYCDDEDECLIAATLGWRPLLRVDGRTVPEAF